MLMAPSQVSGDKGKLRAGCFGLIWAFVHIKTRGLLRDVRELAMDTQDVTAYLDQRKLSLCETHDRCLAGLGRHANALPGSDDARHKRSEEHTSELQSLMRISYAVFCLKN